MVSKRWQKKQTVIQHVGLAAIWGGTLFWLQLDLLTWEKITLVVITIGLTFLIGTFFSQRPINTLEKVFKVEEDAATSLVQRALNGCSVPFSRRSRDEGVYFIIRNQDLTLLVVPYPLNLPVDDHIRPIPAARIEISGVTAANQQTAEKMCRAIDETVLAIAR